MESIKINNERSPVFVHASGNIIMIKQASDMVLITEENVDDLIGALIQLKNKKNKQTINCKKDGCKRCNG